jgi:hypothetical protein
MKITEGLQKLIDSAFADGKISKKEKEILLKKSESEGNDRDEFEMYLDGLVHSSKSDSSSDKVAMIMTFFKWLMQKKRRVAIAVIALAMIIGIIEESINNSDRAAQLVERGCENVADCITKYKFEEARTFYSEMGESNYSKNDELRSIISAEISYYTSNQSKELALRSVNEYTFISSSKLQSERNDNQSYNEEANWYNSIVESLVFEFEGDQKTIKKLVYSMKPIMNFKKLIKEYKDYDGEVCCSHLDMCSFQEDNSKKESLMKRYKLK